MSSKHVVRLGVLLVFIVGCADGFNLTDIVAPDTPAHAISDGTFGGTAGFHFLQPLVKNPAYAGTFDPGHEPVVEVLCVTAGCGPAVHATFDQDGANGSETVRVEDDHYIVNWHSGHTGAVAGQTYRIRVHVGEHALGYVDVAVVRNGKEAVSARASGLVAIVAGQTAPVRFRVETDIVVDLVVSPAEATIDVGDTQQFQAAFLDLHGQEVAGPGVSWSSSDSDVATVSAAGVATGVGPGNAVITAAAGALSGTATLAVEASAGEFLSPGDTETVASLNGWSVRCLAWSGRTCTRPQMKVDCGTCGAYGSCDVWHEVTTANNNLQQPTTQNFCAIAAGSAAVSSSGTTGIMPSSPRGCGFNTDQHPLCGPGEASFHVPGFGILESYGLLLDDDVCSFDFDPQLTVDCTAW